MMWRLKDRELQRKLDAISGGDFSKQIGRFDADQNSMRHGLTIRIAFGPTGGHGFQNSDGKFAKYCVTLDASEIEPVPQYDPHAWNPWPGVEPPNDTQYFRVEFDVQSDGECVHRGERWMWEASRRRWVDDTGAKVYTEELARVRYRPWDDPDDQEEDEIERAGGTD